MKTYQVIDKKEFIGRGLEMARLREAIKAPGAHILVVYGRRRVGKTALLEHVFKDRHLLKFEGREKQDEDRQRLFVMRQLAEYAEDPLYADLTVKDWIDVFKYIYEKTKEGEWTIYFEELQWLANYKDEFISSLKYMWDNYFQRNEKLVIILCGSSPSFMIKGVVKSKALYNRSQYQLALKEFNLIEARQMLEKHSEREVIDAYLTLGGIPEYLQRLKNSNSVYQNICKESFLSSAFFSTECERIFTSSLNGNKYYREIIDFLGNQKFATRREISKHLKIKTGGMLTGLLSDLQICGFIEKYTPFNLDDKSLLARYAITDSYLRFYFKFIHPNVTKIENGDFDTHPEMAINIAQYQQWLGYSFERFCRKYHRVIANILGFGGIKYQSGTYFKRKLSDMDRGYQIDLIFDRDDRVITICEIRYKDKKISSSVIDEVERKIEFFENPQKRTIQKVLICNFGPDESLERRFYFDRIIHLEELFNPIYW